MYTPKLCYPDKDIPDNSVTIVDDMSINHLNNSTTKGESPVKKLSVVDKKCGTSAKDSEPCLTVEVIHWSKVLTKPILLSFLSIFGDNYYQNKLGGKMF